MAAPPTSGVSASPTISAAVILPSSTVRVTVTGPAKPSAVALKLPPSAGASAGASSAGASSAGASSAGASSAPPAALASAAAAASFTAVEVKVAPATPSISALPAATSCSARVGMAAPPTSGVSASPTMSAAVILPSSTVRVTVTGPAKPSAVASKVVPSAIATQPSSRHALNSIARTFFILLLLRFYRYMDLFCQLHHSRYGGGSQGNCEALD